MTVEKKIAVRSLVFFNECSIMHAPLLDCVGLIVLEECVYIMDNSCYIRTVQQLGFYVPSPKFTDSDESIG